MTDVRLQTLAAAGVLGPLDVALAEVAVRRIGRVDADVALALALASRAPGRGDVGFAVDAPPADWPDGLAWPTPEAWARALADGAVVRRPEDDRPALLVHWDGVVALERLWRREEALVAAVRARITVPDLPFGDVALETDLRRLFPGEDPAPRAAARAASRRPLAVVTGGPGTGKTSLVAGVIALLAAEAARAGQAAPRVVLAAPTGKAAARMGEALRISMEARVPPELRPTFPLPAGQTLHRALGAWAGGFRRDREDPLDADLVVVDEASMVSLDLMAALLDAVPPTARLVLLGDPDQLASVEHGAVLADLCAALDARTHQRLTTSHRFGDVGGLAALADAVRRGDADAALAALSDAASPEVQLVSGDPTPTLRRRCVEAWSGLAVLPPDGALAAFDRLRVLSPHHEGRRGVTGLNRDVEGWLADRGAVARDQEWYLGRPVLVTENDRDLRLFNGDVAVIGARGSGRAAWLVGSDGRMRAVPPVALPAHETTFAATVHKSQGSEHDHVVLVLPEQASPVLTRELVYTAVTRARRSVTILGEPDVLAEAIRRRTVRISHFTAWLRRTP